jgi:hypothetical protein
MYAAIVVGRLPAIWARSLALIRGLRRTLRLEDDGREARRPAREDPMNWNIWIRQIHRWTSLVFTATVIANIVAIALGKAEQPPGLLTYSPLLPLFLLLFTGLYLFALPYVTRWRQRKV